jgi:hypothetical protein
VRYAYDTYPGHRSYRFCCMVLTDSRKQARYPWANGYPRPLTRNPTSLVCTRGLVVLMFLVIESMLAAPSGPSLSLDMVGVQFSAPPTRSFESDEASLRFDNLVSLHRQLDDPWAALARPAPFLRIGYCQIAGTAALTLSQF